MAEAVAERFLEWMLLDKKKETRRSEEGLKSKNRKRLTARTNTDHHRCSFSLLECAERKEGTKDRLNDLI